MLLEGMLISYAKYIYIGILILLCILGLFFLNIHESFADSTESEEEKLTLYMTVASEALCPSIFFILDDIIGRYNIQGTDSEKKKKAFELLSADAGGPMFPCPPPNDPAEIPVNIDKRIRKSIRYLYVHLNRAITKVQEALNCVKKDEEELDKEKNKEDAEDSRIRSEGFYDISQDSQLQPREDQKTVQSEAAKESVKQTTVPKTISKEDRMQLLKLRLNVLTPLMTNPNITNQLVMIQSMTSQLFAIKKAAEENKIRPTCSKSSEADADNVSF